MLVMEPWFHLGAYAWSQHMAWCVLVVQADTNAFAYATLTDDFFVYVQYSLWHRQL
jgi:hypothetical protein